MSEHELHARVHDAYESFGPSDESYDRVLLTLKDAQAQQAKAPRRIKAWWVLAPLAAACAVVVVLVSMNASGASAPQAATEAAGDAVAANKDLAAEEPVMEEQANEAAYEGFSATQVTLADGTTFTVGEELSKAPTWSHTEDAVAVDATTHEERPCIVADRAYVRFEGEQIWHELKAAE